MLGVQELPVISTPPMMFGRRTNPLPDPLPEPLPDPLLSVMQRA
jgi:hypothetical protein